MALEVGSRLGHHQVTVLIGEGGMTNEDIGILVAFRARYEAVFSVVANLEKAAAKAELSGRARGGSK